jgi:hypothetical protein
MLDTLGFATPTAGHYRTVPSPSKAGHCAIACAIAYSKPWYASTACTAEVGSASQLAKLHGLAAFDDQAIWCSLPSLSCRYLPRLERPNRPSRPHGLRPWHVPGFCLPNRLSSIASIPVPQSSDRLAFPKTVRSKPADSNTRWTPGSHLRKHALGALLKPTVLGSVSHSPVSRCAVMYMGLVLHNLVSTRISVYEPYSKSSMSSHY